MKQILTKNRSLAERLRPEEALLSDLGLLLQQVGDLANRIAGQISAITHAETQNPLACARETELFLGEYRQLSQRALMLRTPIEARLKVLGAKSTACSSEPIPATALQNVVMLHLVSEQTMGRRLEELREVEKRQKEYIAQLESGLRTVSGHFEELAKRLNLLCYMRSCLEHEGVLPASIMYISSIPQHVSSPFTYSPQVAKRQIFNPLAPSAEDKPDQDQVRRELEKKRELLLQLRELARQQKAKTPPK
jgi:hypothetical protein